MKSTEFCYWLQGMFELNPSKELNAEQTETIKKHLEMVFFHEIDKSYPEHQQNQLFNLHGKSKDGELLRC